ncbi:MAG: ABC transporter permease [Fimbriimonadaceae bacterium]|nr:ABC transporter permease [Chthonomonadaceae bacterium]MCO5296087.1 ABC transporter permease [Fimbriimonadaceae bacterium]
MAKTVRGGWSPWPLAESFFTFVGEIVLLLLDAARRLPRRPWELRETVQQMAFIGAASVPIVALTNFFSGAVLALYSTEFLLRYGGGSFVGGTVGLAVSREIGPVLAGIMVAARCGSAMAAQIGTMAVTEQIDALKMLSVHPTNYLVIPRMVAAIAMLPVLALVGIYTGVAGGWLVAMASGVPSPVFLQSLQQYVKPWDFVGGMVKTPVFGLIIALVACQQGLRTRNGAVGVGNSTTNTVVISMVMVYVANYFLAAILFR